jgi:hypothetical protein
LKALTYNRHFPSDGQFWQGKSGPVSTQTC